MYFSFGRELEYVVLPWAIIIHTLRLNIIGVLHVNVRVVTTFSSRSRSRKSSNVVQRPQMCLHFTSTSFLDLKEVIWPDLGVEQHLSFS